MKKSIARRLLFFLLLGVFGISVFAQDITISGTVTDAADGSPLPGVSIVVKGTTSGTAADLDGMYTLTVAQDAILVFSFIGYNSLEVPVEGRLQIDVQLTESYEELEELIVIGYGTQKKTDKTGAVSNITNEELNIGVLTDPIAGLTGKTAGVMISKKGGDPNSGYSVKIRGASGLESGTNPLYVVDGVPGVDPTTIATEDIESFNVLKDASSTAIYGSRGANGVIIITTKSGKGATGSNVSFNSYVSMDMVANRLDLLSADQVRDFATENGLNLVDGGANTDWQDVIYRTGLSQSYNLAFSGGDANTNYHASVTHLDFEGVVKGTNKKRTLGRLNLNQKALNDKLTLSAGLSGTFEKNDYIDYNGNGPNDVLYQAFQRNPTDPVYNDDGSFYELQRNFQYYNPLALIEQIQNERSAKRFYGNLKADLEIIEGLHAKLNLGYIRDDSESFYFEPTYVRDNTTTGYAKRAYDNVDSKIMEATVSYTNTFSGIHNLDAVAGYSFQEDGATGLMAQGNEPLSNFVQSNNLGVINKVVAGRDIDSYKSSNRLISFFGRVVYNLDSKYYLTATMRRDGSSRFGDKNKWGLFPSASISWNIKREEFMANVDWLGQLKLRVGYGLVGNQEIDNYLNIRTNEPSGPAIDPETGLPAIGFEANHNANPYLKWEENRELNIGVDFGFFNNRVSGSLDLYDKTTYDLLADYTVPVPPNALSHTFANVGTISNKGIELNIQGYAVDRANIKWRTMISATSNRQKVLKLSDKDYEWTPLKEGWLQGRGLVGAENWTQVIEPGKEIGTFYMPEFAGISSDGKFLFYTEAGGVTRNLELAERRVVGHALPRFELGWSNFFTIYDNIDASFTIRGMYGNDVLNVTRLMFGNPQWLPNNNVLESALEEYDKGLNDNPKVNSYYLEDGSFIRLDNVSVGYTFDTQDIEWISKLRVYIASNNTFLLTNYTGIDPETNFDGLSFGLDQYNVYPKTRTFTLGVNLNF